MNLDHYDQYWNAVSSSPNKERDHLKNKGSGEALGAQTAMIQNNHLGNLKRLFDKAGVDDWTAHIDHTATYNSNKQNIIDTYSVDGFEKDREKKLDRLEAEEEKLREEAPDDVPTTLDEQLRRGQKTEINDDVEVEHIGSSINNNSNSNGEEKNGVSVGNNYSEKGNDKIQSQENSSTKAISLSKARSRCLQAVEKAYNSDRVMLLDALPGIGKSYSAIEAVSTTDTPITILTSRGRKGRYAEIRSWCQKHGLSSKVLPRVDDKCPSFAGKHGPPLEQKLKDYRNLGVTASDLHTHWDLPCQKGSGCPYESEWDFEPDDYEVIIGHYTHAYVEIIVENRVVVIDEAPSDAFLTEFTDPHTTITNFLQQTSNIPFSNYHRLLTNSDSKKKELALNWFNQKGIGLGNSKQILDKDSDNYHIHTPLLVLGTLKANDLGNNWSTSPLGGGQVFSHNQNLNKMYVLDPPTLVNAKNVVALDGAPTPRLYDLMLGLNFNHKQLLTDTERERYIRHTQNIKIIQTELKSIYPYSSGNHANLDRDEALLREVAKRHSCQPAVITSDRVLNKLKSKNIPISANSTYYGNLKGSNKLANEDVGVILGSPHYGDPFIERWAALFGTEATGNGQGLTKSYGAFGDEILQHMRENEVLQAIFRFARDGSGSTVYVNTAAIPSWLPREIALGVVRKRSTIERDIIEALSDLCVASGADIARETGHNKNTVRSNLRKIQQEGLVRKTGKKKGTQWHDDGLSGANTCGLVDLNSLTDQTHNISIGDIGDKIEHQLEQYGVDQHERDRLLGDGTMTNWRTN
ncbi:hypothetical protein GS429_20665 [Natronorubrum sp. JWXQ-INN-674]|uniref:Uncharacterized protein n=1 Tax=Natronorubrum halalkaliphilum TaxID=2691917 RepID=A0A6B0VU57_9EURY|nr:hypothetical protein [Natronorubrum halalkaliphilum]MXV64436.1 hypothetical protein [Natronorubrum halalkaliphilum]